MPIHHRLLVATALLAGGNVLRVMVRAEAVARSLRDQPVPTGAVAGGQSR